MRILGIDPGIRNTGWGVIDTEAGRLRHLGNGVIKPDPKLPDADRLAVIAKELGEVINSFQPAHAVIEEIFVAKSAASALKLGMARGVAMMVCGQHDLGVGELAARLVKKTVTGTGTADKRQIQDMVNRLLNVQAANADAADALAIAIAGANDAGTSGANISGVANAVSVGSTKRKSGGSASDSGASNLSKAIEAALAKDAQRASGKIKKPSGSNEDGQ